MGGIPEDRASPRGPRARTVSASGDKYFVTTRWTLVVKAQAGVTDSTSALGELCEAYYAPVQAFICAAVRDPERARDLTQEFFARVLRGGAFVPSCSAQ